MSAAALRAQQQQPDTLQPKPRAAVPPGVRTVPADSIVPRAPVGSLSQLLNGRSPGLVVLSKDGSVGAGASVFVRGPGQPLLVIDGVRADNDPGVENPAAPDHPAPARFDDLDPDEIDHIDILPGAAAATLYGPDAGNGVILVTTKHATAKAKGEITAEGARVSTPLDVQQNYYSWGHQGGTPVDCISYLRATGQCTLDSVTQFNPLLSSSTTPLNTVYQERVGATIEGTSATQRLLLTGHYLDAPGTLQMPGPDVGLYRGNYGFAPARSQTLPNREQQGDIRGSFGLDLGKAADVDITAGYTSRYQRDPSLDAILTHAAESPGFVGATDGWPDSVNRPWHDLADVSRENARHFNGGVGIHFNPSKLWATHLTLGVDAVDQTAGDIVTIPPQFGVDTTLGYDHTRFTQYTADLGVTLTEGAAAQAQSQTTFGLQYLAEHFRDSTYHFTGNSGGYQYQLLNPKAGSQSRALYGREALTFANKLVVAGGVRGDNQRLRAANLVSWTLDPTVDASVAIVGSVADPRLRVRGALGQTSTLPDARQLGPIFNLGLLYDSFCSPSVVGEPCLPPLAIRPERQRELEAGVDASAPGDRFSAGFTVYARRNIHELIPEIITEVSSPLLSTDSFDLPDAITTDRGIEFNIGATFIDRPTFEWDASLLASENTDKVLRMNDIAGAILPAPLQMRPAIGHPIYGVWTTPYAYNDANHDGVIEPNEITYGSFNSRYVGPGVPSHVASLSTSIQPFKRHVRVSALFDYRGGYVLPNPSVGFNAPALNVAGASLADQAAAVASQQNTDVTWQRVDAVRWRELSATVGTVGPNTVQFTVAVRNLALWSNYRGDPDRDLTAMTLAEQLPQSRTYLLRVTAGF